MWQTGNFQLCTYVPSHDWQFLSLGGISNGNFARFKTHMQKSAMPGYSDAKQKTVFGVLILFLVELN